MPRSFFAFAAAMLMVIPNVVIAQQRVHTPGMSHDSATAAGRPTMPGQAAFAAIAEIVRLLDADVHTDWSKVDLESLRQHLMDMDDVMVRAEVRREDIPGGVAFTVTGAGRTRDAIRRMSLSHGATVTPADGFTWTATEHANGARVTVVARAGLDAGFVARLRALGFHGLLSLGDHHTTHHLGIASGTMRDAHRH